MDEKEVRELFQYLDDNPEALLRARAEIAIKKAQKQFPEVDYSVVKFKFFQQNRVDGRRAGQISWNGRESAVVSIHKGIVKSSKCEGTILHELAHWIAHVKWNDNGHGYYWGHCMIMLGQLPSKTCSMEESRMIRGRSQRFEAREKLQRMEAQ